MTRLDKYTDQLGSLCHTRTLQYMLACLILAFLFLLYVLISATNSQRINSQALRMNTQSQQTKQSLIMENLTDFITVPRTHGGHVKFHYISDPKLLKNPQSAGDDLLENVTLVSAYFNLGTFEKNGDFYTTRKYTDWLKKFSRVNGYLVFYTDDDEIVKLIADVRNKLLNKTKVIKVERKDLWAFSLRDNIANVYSLPSYPKYTPNTVNPDYTCAMHAKYDVVQLAMESNHFRTKYFAWVDMGYFREFKVAGDLFTLGLPPAFDNRTIAFNEIFTMYQIETYNIFVGNNVWVGGGFFLGYRSVLISFIQQYRVSVEKYLKQGLSDTDQQVIYAMYHQYKEHKRKSSTMLNDFVPLQVYQASGPGNPWFYLGKICILGPISF